MLEPKSSWNRVLLFVPRSWPALAGLSIVAAACAGAPAPRIAGAPALPAGATALSQPAAAETVATAPAAPQADLVGSAIPRLRGVPPGQQLRTLKWMLAVPDDRRLVFLFADLRGDRQQSLEDRGFVARQRLRDFVVQLESAGHRAPDPGRDIARIDDNAPPPLADAPPRADKATPPVPEPVPRPRRPPES